MSRAEIDAQEISKVPAATLAQWAVDAEELKKRTQLAKDLEEWAKGPQE